MATRVVLGIRCAKFLNIASTVVICLLSGVMCQQDCQPFIVYYNTSVSEGILPFSSPIQDIKACQTACLADTECHGVLFVPSIEWEDNACFKIIADTNQTYQYIGSTYFKVNTECGDVDECALNISGCQHVCVNTPFSFYCVCYGDYTLDSNGKTCSACASWATYSDTSCSDSESFGRPLYPLEVCQRACLQDSSCYGVVYSVSGDCLKVTSPSCVTNSQPSTVYSAISRPCTSSSFSTSTTTSTSTSTTPPTTTTTPPTTTTTATTTTTTPSLPPTTTTTPPTTTTTATTTTTTPSLPPTTTTTPPTSTTTATTTTTTPSLPPTTTTTPPTTTTTATTTTTTPSLPPTTTTTPTPTSTSLEYILIPTSTTSTTDLLSPLPLSTLTSTSPSPSAELSSTTAATKPSTPIQPTAVSVGLLTETTTPPRSLTVPFASESQKSTVLMETDSPSSSRPTIPAPGCSMWTSYNDSMPDDFVLFNRSLNVSTLEQCQAACIQDLTCRGVAYTPLDVVWKMTCVKVSSEAASTSTLNGVTFYKLYRDCPVSPDVTPKNITATCIINSTSGLYPIFGVIRLSQSDAGGPTRLGVSLSGFNSSTPGYHGFHVHEYGNLSNSCLAAGAHYNPDLTSHGGPQDPVRHVGDLGNVFSDMNGEVNTVIFDTVLSLIGNRSVVGRSIVVHSGEDDYGRGGYADSNTTGHAGVRYGCCLIVVDTADRLRNIQSFTLMFLFILTRIVQHWL